MKLSIKHVVIGGIIVTFLLWMWLLMNMFPIPKGVRVNEQYYTYKKNIWGIYYISVESRLALLNVGTYRYLNDYDSKTFVVLDNNWAKDKNHVWYCYDVLDQADVASFHIDKSGLPKDKNHIYLPDDGLLYSYHPSKSSIDVESAEYFNRQNRWANGMLIRDKENVYLDEEKVDVDRNTFKALGNSYWLTDKNYVYFLSWYDTDSKWKLEKVDSLQSPLDTLVAGSQYLRNGRDIIYMNKVILSDIDVKRFEDIGVGKCVVNNMLFLNGEQILKNRLNVDKARFYFYGHIAADGQHVFYHEHLLKGIDAASFRQINEETFEDKNYIYTIKESSWNEEDPFNRKKK